MSSDSNHPRAASLKIRDQIVWGVKQGITSTHGLVAQGRGEAFDYLLGEETHDFASIAIECAAAVLLLARFPVISVNGNSVVLGAESFIRISDLLSCPIEVNLFHRTLEREELIRNFLLESGAKRVVGVGKEASSEIDGIASKRKYVSPFGIKKADVVLVPLEDGDRAGALENAGKKVIAIDLNPLSRTSVTSSVTIVDNIIRALPLLAEKIEELKKIEKKNLEKIVQNYDNALILKKAEKRMRSFK